MAKEIEDTSSELEEDYLLPSRSTVHSPVKGKLTRMFYSTIVTLFILLILTLIGLFLYHNEL